MGTLLAANQNRTIPFGILAKPPSLSGVPFISSIFLPVSIRAIQK